MAIPHLNILAILAAAVAAFMLGALWYSPLLFAKAWVKAHGYTDEKIAEMQKGAPKAYAVSFVCFLGIAIALAVLIGRMEIHTALGGLKVAGVCWLGFAATIGLTANMYSDKPLSTWLIDVGYQFVYFMLMGAILGVWR